MTIKQESVSLEDAQRVIAAGQVKAAEIGSPSNVAVVDAGGNLARAAEALHVHVNTLYQRGERIARLLSPRWREPDEALQLHLALQVRRLQAALGD